MKDILDRISDQIRETISQGYYDTQGDWSGEKHSLVTSIKNCKGNAVITEIKPRSPSMGILNPFLNINRLTQEYASNGSVGISVLTEPEYFQGSLLNLKHVRKTANIPILMKDFIIDPVQIYAAKCFGADVVLFIKSLFDRGHCEQELSEMIKLAHHLDIEVLLETHSLQEFNEAIDTDVDLIGINNRDLKSLEIDLSTTINIMKEVDGVCKPVISESGVQTIQDLLYLRSSGVDAFLVGTALMKSNNPGDTLKELIKG